MENKNIVTKIVRYLELSKSFNKTFNELFGEAELGLENVNNSSGLTYSSGLTLGSGSGSLVNSFITIDGKEVKVNESGFLVVENKDEMSNGELLKLKLSLTKLKVDAYNEYLELHKELSTYFNSYNEILK